MLTAIELDACEGVQLWLVDLEAGSESHHWPDLVDAEKARAARFVFARDRRRYVAAHSALRRLVAARTGRAIATLHFDEGEFGKPYLVGDPGCAFNLSHSEAVGLIAISGVGELGVDVELLRPVPDAVALSLDNFTVAEQAELRTTDAVNRDLVFLWGWTRKEACLKAIGSGLSIRPDSFEVGLTPKTRDVVIETDRGPIAVNVRSFRHGPEVLGALAQVL